MALINLPGHTEEYPIQWDDTKKMHQQTDAAQVYVFSVINSTAQQNILTEVCSPSGQPSAERRTEWKHIDVKNNYEIKICPIYHHSTTHRLFSAIREIGYFVTTI